MQSIAHLLKRSYLCFRNKCLKCTKMPRVTYPMHFEYSISNLGILGTLNTLGTRSEIKHQYFLPHGNTFRRTLRRPSVRRQAL